MEHITKEKLQGIWNYYLSIENDLENTSRYVEPIGQESVHSFEFAKIIILSCTEIESVFKAICYEFTGEEKGNIGEYKRIILSKFPKIITAEVTINRLGRQICPFSGWENGNLAWWNSYTLVKHNRESCFSDASYINAVMALSALYILIFYLAEIRHIGFSDTRSMYIYSDYEHQILASNPPKRIPDYDSGEDNVVPDRSLVLSSAKKLY